MKRIAVLLLFPLLASCLGQQSIDGVLQQYNRETIPYIEVDELARQTGYLLLDTREKEEFEVSRLENAIWVGHNNFAVEKVLQQIPDKDTAIVVYCSVGVRSEDVGEQLKEAGYTRVQNLYGGIFAWKNQGNTVVGPDGKPTEKVHAYSKYWGRLLTNGDKVYSP